ncbi:MAG: alpha/beta hydrolase [Candidatus Nomurabacteria bacterium]|nr:MAG: alpha/beta hydrolase [Candidatus Nomurabacteria bacterium]
MATNVSVSVAQSTHDGFQAWNQRGNASGVDFTTALKYPIIGPHYDDSLFLATFYIFKFDNVPQGSQISSCTLSLRTNNAYTGGLTNHIYVAVENNLDVNGSGAVVNGTLGSMPWQRLGRQTASTTLFGNRCGPTHNKAGFDLSNYGAHVRDSSALIYKAFCTNQSSGSALGRDLSAGSWVDTENFASAIQPLVNDSGWNSTTQYVMVYLFADDDSGTTYNVGNLGSFTWDNGTVGATGYGNGNGQNYFYDQSAGLYAPKINLTYTSASLKAVNSGSLSSGNVRLRPALCLGSASGTRVELLLGNGVIPKMTAGAGDKLFTWMDSYNPNGTAWGASGGNPPGARIKWDGIRPGRVDGTSIFLEDYPGDTPRLSWQIGEYQSEYSSRNVYSLRFYHRYEGNSGTVTDNGVVEILNGGAGQFRIEHKHYDGSTLMQLRIAWSGNATAWTSYQFTPPAGNGYYRYEIQVDSTQTPKVRLRVYLNDNTTPIETLTASPPNVEMDEVRFGGFDTDTTPLMSSRLSDVEIWTDYLLNRRYPDSLTNTVGTPYEPQKWAWFEYDGTTSKQLDDLGEVSSIDGGGGSVVLDSSKALTYEDIKAELWTGATPNYTLYSDLSYGAGNYRKLDLYIPTGTPPANGWPVILWAHGGYWSSGNKTTIPNQFVRNCCLKGYAVASLEYVLHTVITSGAGSYPAWDPNTASGRYPTMILNYKEATYWLKTKSSTNSGGDGTYNIDAGKFIASGHSAGGYNALGAVVSKGLTNDGGGRDLTLAGNVGSFGCPNVADPTYLGAYIVAGPINLNYLKSWDPTHPDWPYLDAGAGSIYATCRVFRGENYNNGVGDVNNCGIDDMVLLNPSVIPSIAYAWAPSDNVVVSNPRTPYSQEKRLSDVMTTVAGSLPPTTTYEGYEVYDALHHTIHDVDFDFQHFFRWLESLPGL